MNPEFFKGMDGLTPVYDRMSKAIAETREKFPSGWSLAAEALAMAELLVLFRAANVGLAENDYRRNLLATWNRIRLYQQNSFILIIGQQLDEGLAVLRMAAELTFIFKAVQADPKNLRLWVKEGSPRSGSFKAAARMDLTNPTEKRLYELYKYCSRFGIHGHLTSEIYWEPEESGVQAADYVASRVLCTWFVDFMPPHTFAFETLPHGNKWEGIDEWRIHIGLMELKLLAAIKQEGFFR